MNGLFEWVLQLGLIKYNSKNRYKSKHSDVSVFVGVQICLSLSSITAIRVLRVEGGPNVIFLNFQKMCDTLYENIKSLL